MTTDDQTTRHAARNERPAAPTAREPDRGDQQKTPPGWWRERQAEILRILRQTVAPSLIGRSWITLFDAAVRRADELPAEGPVTLEAWVRSYTNPSHRRIDSQRGEERRLGLVSALASRLASLSGRDSTMAEVQDSEFLAALRRCVRKLPRRNRNRYFKWLVLVWDREHPPTAVAVPSSAEAPSAAKPEPKRRGSGVWRPLAREIGMSDHKSAKAAIERCHTLVLGCLARAGYRLSPQDALSSREDTDEEPQ